MKQDVVAMASAGLYENHSHFALDR